MSIIVCKSCSSEHSKNAVNCPKCGYDRTDKEKPCRVCNTMLSVKYHRFVHYSQSVSVSDGNSYVNNHYTFMHRSCPKCGDPYPLKCAMDNEYFRGLTKLFLIIISLVIAVIVGGLSILALVELSLFTPFVKKVIAFIVAFIVLFYAYVFMREKVVGY